jgi:hypothetical protein
MGVIYDWEDEGDFEDDWGWWEDERIKEDTRSERLNKEFKAIIDATFSDEKERMILDLKAKEMDKNG